ncbi:MAG: hypothetical protein RBU37_11340 [Myxococcota bacterium]|nr:hypothetical protein [Myxococcota bacterium]
MNANEQYLRNLIIMARADGQLQYPEKALLEQIRAELGASQEELKMALSAFGNPCIRFEVFERFSVKVRNFEDLVAIALADGQLGGNERVLLIEAAMGIGLSQEQSNQIIASVAKMLQGD